MATKETKDYTVNDVLEALSSTEDKQAWFAVRRRFPAIETVDPWDVVRVLAGDKPAFVLEKKLRDAFFSEEEKPEKPAKPVKIKKEDEDKPAKKPEPAKPVKVEKTAKPEKAEKPEKTKSKVAVDDIDALIAEIDGEGGGDGDMKGGDDDPDSDDDD